MRRYVHILALAAVFAPVAVAAAGPDAKSVERGHKIYVTKCARCHKMYDPNKYDAGAWEMWMSKMKTKSRLKDDDYARLVAYVNTIRSSQTANAATEESEP
jgi:cytochrome c553